MNDYAIGAAALAQPGWQWDGRGLVVMTTDAAGQPVRVRLPLVRVAAIFDACCAREGAPLPPTVGDFSVGGFFKKIGRGIRRFGRRARRGISRASRKVSRVAKRVGRVAVSVGRNKFFRAGVGALAVAFPAVAPAAAALEAANQIYNRIEAGRKAAQAISRGVRSGSLSRAVREGARATQAAGRALQRAEGGDRGAAQFASAFLGRRRGASVVRLSRRVSRAGMKTRALRRRFR